MVFQLGAALLDACVLGTLKRQDAYGYSLTQQIKAVVDVSESTLYPVLRRLLKEELVTSYDQAFDGRNRRYYRITESGSERLRFYIAEWEQYKTTLDSLLEGGIEHGNDPVHDENAVSD